VSFPLNEGQRRAALTLEGPVLVSAGAGTGKTRALAERFVSAVAPNRVEGWAPASVDELLTITFTDKAAGELSERIRAALRGEGLPSEARELDGAWISTIHGFCARLLRRHALEAGLDPGFAVADETESRVLREEAFERTARRLHDSSAAVSGLFSLYGFQPVWDSVARITREIETRGLAATDLRIESAPPVRTIFDETLEFFAEAETELGRHACSIKGAANHVCACRTLLERLEPLGAEELTDEELAVHLWRSLSEYSARGGSAGPIKHVCETLAEMRQRLLGEAVSVLTRPHAAALVELASAYLDVLAALKLERGVLDFADLQLHAARLLEARPDLRERYRAEFRLVMVDEFQDTDELQLRIVRAVTGNNLCTVGDERQSIYRFRGADLEVYRRHREEMADAGARPVQLVENYRSHPDIIGFVNQVFGSRELFGEQLLCLEACRTEPEPPALPPGEPRIAVDLVHVAGLSKAASCRAEAEAIAARLSELRDAGVSAGEMVVLVRRYASADPIVASLRRAGFPVLVVGGRRFLELPEVAMVRALCRVVANPRDDAALARLLLSPMSAVSDDGVWLLRNAEAARASGRHLWEGLAAAEAVVERSDVDAAVELREVLRRACSRAGSMPLSEVLMRAIEESRADLVLLGRGDEGLQAFANVLRFVRKADEFERSGGAGAAAFTARVDAEERFGNQEVPSAVTDDGSPAVRIMSVHASKGLEFPVVALPALGDPAPADTGVLRVRPREERLEIALALPSSLGGKPAHRRTPWFEEMRAHEALAQAEESRRLLYVACTRAREVLLLSGAGNLEKDPDEGADSSLGHLRRALRRELGGEPGTRDLRALENGTQLSVRIHEVPEDSVADKPAPSGIEPRAARPEAPESGIRASEDANGESQRASAGAPAVRPDRLSYSDIRAFESCPLRYWAQSVARLGEMGSAGDSDPMRFGSALHALLQASTPDAPMSDEERPGAIARYHRLGKDESVRLREAAERFVGSRVAVELARSATLRREYPFSASIVVGEHSFELAGAMDAYGRTGDDALIVDYKSGISEASAEQLRERYETQARCYAYAALREGCERARVVFVRPEVVGPEGDVQQVLFDFDSSDAPSIERYLVGVYQRIAEAPYLPLAEWDDTTCRGCRIAGSLCPLTPPRRGAG
jgi:ATP-dependent exoDNAse (exonuclease V) beta subunit